MQQTHLRRFPLYAAMSLTLGLGLVACGGGQTTPTGIAINAPASGTTLTVGQSVTLTASTTVTWSSSDSTIATVDSTSGLVTPLAPGTVTITGTAADGTSGSITFTVVAAGGGNTLASISFRPADAKTALPAGFTADNGAGYSGNFGWVSATTTSGAPVPTTATIETRDRRDTSKPINGGTLYPSATDLQVTLAQMQPKATGSKPQLWEYKLANGTYNVTIGMGDAIVNNQDSKYAVDVEGAQLGATFTPSGSTTDPAAAKVLFEVSGDVTVSDGYLTLSQDATNGSNVKLNYVIIKSTSSAASK